LICEHKKSTCFTLDFNLTQKHQVLKFGIKAQVSKYLNDQQLKLITKIGQIRISLFFYNCFQFVWTKAYINPCFHPFLFPFPWLFKPCCIFSLIYLGRFDGNILEAFANFLISSCILISLGKGISKTCPLGKKIHTQSFTIKVVNFNIIIIILKLEPSCFT
jgi:hypothetical protein